MNEADIQRLREGVDVGLAEAEAERDELHRLAFETAGRDEAEIEAIANRIAELPAERKVDVLLGMLGKVADERDLLQDEVGMYRNQAMPEAAAVLGGLSRELSEVTEERDRLQAIVDVADDFWPVIESICDQARASWEQNEPGMKYVTVQISKVDLPTLNAAYRCDEDADG
jgi:hypothetical protein